MYNSDSSSSKSSSSAITKEDAPKIKPSIESLRGVSSPMIGAFTRGSFIKPKPDPIPFRDTFRKSSLELQMRHLEQNDLFANKVGLPEYDMSRCPSLLLHGFTMRRVESLQKALNWYNRHQTREERQLALQRLFAEQKSLVEARARSEAAEEEYEALDDIIPTQTMSEPLNIDQLAYLLGLDTAPAEEDESKSFHVQGISSVNSEESLLSQSLAMRNAHKYLRVHKIFEFFQFLIAHLLSSSPDDPIDFLLLLLDKCLIYRTGLGCPPLLHEKGHIEQLFKLMDRIGRGFIEISQYDTGMRTLGICSYNKTPVLNAEGMVSKDTFVMEAYDCLTDILNSMIKVRRNEMVLPEAPAPPPTLEDSLSTTSTMRSIKRLYVQEQEHPLKFPMSAMNFDIEKIIRMHLMAKKMDDGRGGE